VEATLEAVQKLGPAVRAAADEIAATRRIPEPLLADIRSAGAIRMPMPAAWGGPELDPLAQVRVIAELAAQGLPAIFVPAGEGKKIDVGDFVEVMPATVKREEHGFIHARVVAVSELPATRRAMEAALQHPDLVEAFTRKYASGVLLRVHVKLQEAPRPIGGDESSDASGSGNADNQFVWSTSSGRNQLLKTGTMCEAAIVVRKQRLIKLILPWFRTLLGTD